MSDSDIESSRFTLAVERIAYYVRFVLICVWFFIVTVVFSVLAIPFWGRTSLAWVYARVLSGGALLIMGVRVRVEGAFPERPVVVMANHQSNFDVIFLGWIYPNHTVVIGKKELLKVPLFGTFFAATRNILIDRTDRSQAVAGLDKAVSALRQSRQNIWIFPEGTRSKGGALQPFKKGGFHMALAAQVPIVLVVLEPIGKVLEPGRRLSRMGTLRARILAPIPTAGKGAEDIEALRQSTEDTFRREMSRLSGRVSRVG